MVKTNYPNYFLKYSIRATFVLYLFFTVLILVGCKYNQDQESRDLANGAKIETGENQPDINQDAEEIRVTDEATIESQEKPIDNEIPLTDTYEVLDSAYISTTAGGFLQGLDSTIVVNQDSFNEELSINLAEGVTDISEIESIVVSESVTIDFTKSIIAKKPVIVSLSLKQPLENLLAEAHDSNGSDQILAMVKAEGEESFFGHSAVNKWLPTLAKFNERTNKYDVNIHATAKQLSIVLVSKEGILKHRVEPEEVRGDNNAIKAFKKVKKQKSVKSLKMVSAGDNNWGNRGWGVWCVFNDPNDVARFCNRDDENSAINLLKSNLAEATRKLINDGGMLEAKLEPEIVDGKMYNTAFLGDNDLCGYDASLKVLACYVLETGTLMIQKSLFEQSPDWIKFAIAHEIAHAVQAAKTPNLFYLGNAPTWWITEGLADHAASFIINKNLATAPIREKRDWSNPLASSFGKNQYQVSEFWAMPLDLNQNYLLLNDLGETGMLPRVNAYQAVSNVFGGVWNMTLSDLYLEYISALHSLDLNYPYCTDYSPADFQEPFTIHGNNLKPMSAQCYNVHADSSKKLTIEANVLNGGLLPFAFVVNGNITRFLGGEIATVREVQGNDINRLWIFNIYIASNAEIDAGYNYEIKITPLKPKCDFVAECAIVEGGSGCTVYLPRPNCDAGRNLGRPDCAQLDGIFNVLSGQASINYEQSVENIEQACDEYNRREADRAVAVAAHQACVNDPERPRAECADLQPATLPSITFNLCEFTPSGYAWREFTNEDIDCPALDDICENPVFRECN